MAAALIFMGIASLRENLEAYNMSEYYSLEQGNRRTYSYTVDIEGGENDGLHVSIPMQYIIDGTEVVNEVETVKIKRSSPFPPGTDYGYFCYVMDSEGMKMYKDYSPARGNNYIIFDQPSMSFPAQFDVREVHQGVYSSSTYSIDDDTLVRTSIGTHNISLETVEDVTVPAGTFKDCLKITFLYTTQTSDDWTYERSGTSWYALNVGPVKMNRSENSHHPMEEDVDVTIAWKLVRANVDGVQYGCPMVFALGADSKDLNTFRKFRDEVLSKTQAGQEIIKLYYQWSPAIVKAMEQDEAFKKEVKEMIEDILPLIR